MRTFLLRCALPRRTARHTPGRVLVLLVAWLTVWAGLSLLPSTASATLPGANGRILFDKSRAVWTMAPDGSDQQRVVEGGFGSWSPDGTKIAYAAVASDPNSTTGLYVMDADGSNPTLVHEDTTTVQWSSWSPDGSRIAFSSDGVKVVNVDGTGLTTIADKGFDPSWSPDGASIAYTMLPDQFHFDLFVTPADGTGTARNVTRLGGLSCQPSARFPDFSPDGRQLAFSYNSNCGLAYNHIAVIDVDGTGRRELTDIGGPYAGDFLPSWSPEGDRIAFRREEGPDTSYAYNLYTVPAAGGSATRLTSFSDCCVDNPVWQSVPTGPPPPPATPPEVVITTPEDGAAYEQDTSVLAAYYCTDNTAVAACDGPVADGEPIDTSTPGTQQFKVTAVDDEGTRTTKTVSYEVLPAAAPSITITTPQDGARYKVGEEVFADYVCDDGLGVGVQRCTGNVAAGDPVDTAAAGPHSFTVDALDDAGHQRRVSVAYDVVPAGPTDTEPPVIRLSNPVDGSTYKQGEAVRAVYECEDFGSGVKSCSAPVPSGALIDTSTAGGHSFRVDATDIAGNRASRVAAYYVEAGPPPPDTTAPYVLFTTPAYSARYATGSRHLVDYRCIELGQSQSGVATCTGTVANGSTLDTSTDGKKSITVTTTDNAGNSRSTAVFYEVINDRDGDGLSDQWETGGVDVDKDGTVDLALDKAPYNANPDRRDLFVEMDYMTCQLPPATCATGDLTSHAPQAGVAADLVKAFANATGTNPDGSAGISLHLLVDEAVPEIPVVKWYPSAGAYEDVEDVKAGPTGPCNGAFGTAAERASSQCERLLKAKAQVYRWGLFGHLYAEYYGSSGIAEYPGNDFLVTVGGQAAAWTRAAGSLGAAESGTVMHELGHTLGLGHGGPSEDTNCKPNYLSVMSYSLQVPSYDPTRPLDYSRSALPTLDEKALDERAGVGGPAGRSTVYGVNGVTHVAPADSGIDWNDNGVVGGVVAGNPNSVGSCSSADQEQLTGAEDWSKLRYSFNVSPDFASGSRATSAELIKTEITSTQAVAAAESADFDGDGVTNAVDVCRSVADPQQLDLDGDGVGNACDDLNSVTLKVTPEQGTVIRVGNRYIQVAILATQRFASSTAVSTKTLRFGRTGTEAAADRCGARDVNADLRPDLVCLFPLSKTGLPVGTTTAVLKGRTTTSVPITGTTTVRVTK